jgi:hypothetical protein
MKRIPFKRLALTLAQALALTGGLSAASMLHAKTCEQIVSPDPGGCPIKAGPQVVFDRCFAGSLNPLDAKVSDFGNAACDSLVNTKKAADAWKKSINGYLGDAQDDLNKARDRILKDAIDAEAVKAFQEAAQFPQRVGADIKELVDDKQCGVNGTIKRVGTNLDSAKKLLNDGFQIAQRLSAVADTQRPSLDELKKIADELSALANLAKTRGAEGEKALRDLQAAINTVSSNTQQLLQSDFAKVASDGTAVATYIGPFVANCVACATTISTSVSAMAAGGGVAAASPAACTTGAGCALAPIGGIAAAVGGAVGSVVSSQPCQAAAADSAKLKEHVDRIQNFVNATAKLASAIPQNVDRSIKASEALVKLAEELGQEAEPRLKNIQASIDKIVANAAKGGEVLEKEIAPRVTKLAGKFLADMSAEVTVLGTCFNKLLALSGSVGQDTVDGIAKLNAALPNIVDAEKIAQNAVKALDDGKNAMDAFLKREHAKMVDDVRDLHKDVWGVNPGVVDPVKTGQHLAALTRDVRKMNEIARDALALVEKEKQILGKAVNAGIDGFLNGPKLQPAKQKYAAAKTGIEDAKKEFKQAAIKAAKAQMTAKFTVPTAPPSTELILIAMPKAPQVNLSAAVLKAKPKVGK